MKASIAVPLTGLLLLCGCADFGPAVSKTNMGNLEINLLAPEGLDSRAARIYVDDVFIGNASSTMPILQLKRGKRAIRVEVEGADSYTESITILGEPNHQVLNVALKRKTAP
jgi:hypothetical protein